MKGFEKVKPSKLLPLAIFGLGLLTTVLNNKKDAQEKQVMKSEIKKELMKELSSDKD